MITEQFLNDCQKYYYEIENATLGDWLKSLMPVFKQQEPKSTCAYYFPHALSTSQVIAKNCYWFSMLFAFVVIGWSNYFEIVFFSTVEKLL